jgi:hypothetical protein
MVARALSACLALLVLLAAPVVPGAASGQGFPSGAEPPWPMVGRVDPGEGAPGTVVTVTGFNFMPGAVVQLDGQAASDVQIVGPGKLTAVVPPHPPGRVSVTVKNPDGRLGTRGYGFTYLRAPP